MSLAIAHHQAGRLAQAVAGYRQVLLASPNHAEALRLLGLAALQSGDPTNAIALIERAIVANPANALTINSLGEAYRMCNERGLAADCFRRAIALKPDFIEAHNNLAQVHVADQNFSEAAAAFSAILKLRPDDAGAHFELGTIHLHRLQADKARAHFDEALRLKPAYAEARNNLGKALQLEGKLDEALACYRATVAANPDFALPHFNIGMVLHEREQFAAAREEFRRALALDPGLADAHSRMGAAFHAEARFAEARACYERALALRPNDASLHLNIGNAWFVERRLAEAEASYRNALAADPALAQAHVNLGYLYRRKGDMPAAARNFSEALARNPDLAEARWAFTMSKVPLVYGPGESPEAARIDFAKALDELDRWFTGDRVASGHQAVGSQQPFYLAYQEENNVALLSQYGDLCARLMLDWWDRQGLTAPLATAVDSRPIRVGIVSAQIGDHSVWNAIGKGWFRHLDRDRFSLHMFHVGQMRDAETEFVRARSAHFEQSAHGLRGWVDAILGQAPDVLLYPEIGMDPMTSKLASLRLAPVQAASWGHPETTGLPTIDYYLSAEGMEPASPQGNYREKLVMLPHLGCWYESLELPDVDVDFAALGVTPDALVMLCAGTPYKYAPQHDAVLVAIARAVPGCQFVFSIDPVAALSARLRERLENAFRQAGIDPSGRLVFIPFQPRPAFRRLLARADVYLDTIGFSGFNTVMQALECALPVVTMEGRFLRGRFGSGILRRIGLDEWVAGSVDDYVAKAEELGRNADARRETREKIIASRAPLFNDLAPVRALESFLLEVTRPR